MTTLMRRVGGTWVPVLNGMVAHTHLASEITDLGNSATRNVGTTAGTVAAGDDPRLSDARTPTAHTHTKSQITDFAHTHAIADLPVAASGVSSSTLLVRADDSRLSNARTPTAHTHTIADLPVATSGTSNTTQLVRADDSRLSNSRTPTAHTHVKADITDFAHSHAIADLPVATSGTSSTTLLVRADDSRLSDARPPLTHSHAISDLPVATSGTSNATQLVRADDSRLSDARNPLTHTHTKSQITDFAHTHTIADLPTDATVPSALGTAAAGTATTVARRDHVHAMPSAAQVGAEPAFTTLSIAKGGTNSTATPTNGGVGYGTGSAHAYTAAGTAKQVLVSNGAAAPSWAGLDLTYMPDAWIKKTARVATTANITLSGTQTIDTVAVVAGDRVLVKDQTTASQNGIYTVAAGAWTRVAGGDTAAEIAGATISIDQGTQAGQIWTTTFDTLDTLGTSNMLWVKIPNSIGTAATKAQAALTGGGTITCDGSYNLTWSARFIAMGGGRGLHWSTGGYFDITVPPSGTVIPGYAGSTGATATAAGVPLAQWNALYYEPPIGSSNPVNNANFRIVGYTSGSFQVPDHWIFIALRGEGNQVRLGNGMTLTGGQSITVANPYPQYSLTSHTHTKSQITDFAHTHAAADITSGVIATARLGTGTPDTGTYLRGDGTWTTLPPGSIPDSPTITGKPTLGDTNASITRFKGASLQADTLSTEETYTNGLLTQVLEKNGSTTVKTTTLNYTSSVLTSIVEVADGTTVTTTLVYTSGVLTGTTKTVA